MLAPTLSYELNYPRSARVRKRFLMKRGAEMIFLLGLMLSLVQQVCVCVCVCVCVFTWPTLLLRRNIRSSGFEKLHCTVMTAPLQAWFQERIIIHPRRSFSFTVDCPHGSQQHGTFQRTALFQNSREDNETRSKLLSRWCSASDLDAVLGCSQTSKNCLFSGAKSYHLVDILLLVLSFLSECRGGIVAVWRSRFLQRLVVCSGHWRLTNRSNAKSQVAIENSDQNFSSSFVYSQEQRDSSVLLAELEHTRSQMGHKVISSLWLLPRYKMWRTSRASLPKGFLSRNSHFEESSPIQYDLAWREKADSVFHHPVFLFVFELSWQNENRCLAICAQTFASLTIWFSVLFLSQWCNGKTVVFSDTCTNHFCREVGANFPAVSPCSSCQHFFTRCVCSTPGRVWDVLRICETKQTSGATISETVLVRFSIWSACLWGCFDYGRSCRCWDR